MKKDNKKTESFPSDYIELDRQSFWKFNDGSNDRFGIFKEEEQQKIEADQKLQQNQTAYNYQRINLEIEESEWLHFHHQLVDQFFCKYDCIRIYSNGRIYGMKNDNPYLLTIHPDAYRLAQISIKNPSHP
mgnify:CR=1 FL=1